MLGAGARGGRATSSVESTAPTARAAVDFTRPDAVEANVARLSRGRRAGRDRHDAAGTRSAIAALARVRELPVFYAPNFALGAVLMMRFAAEAAAVLPHAEIVELHHESKLDAPSGTAKATAELLRRGRRSTRCACPGLVAHQEVIFGGPGQTLTIRHDTTSREAFVPGVLLALERVREPAARPHGRARRAACDRVRRRRPDRAAASTRS